MNSLNNYIDLLGRKIKCRVTHYEGTATGISFDLYGCVQVAIQPKIDKDGKIPDGRWLDVGRLESDSAERTLPAPDFGSNADTISLLGRWGRDRVTNFEGTISSVIFLLTGKAEVILSPAVDKDGKIPDGKCINLKHVELIGDQRRMESPRFEQPPGILPANPREHQHGPAEKPLP